MALAFHTALRIVLEIEGPPSNDPRDPGGYTIHGISWRFAERIGMTEEEHRALTEDGAANIYAKWFWHKCTCQYLPPGLALVTFDCAVNQGAPRARRLLQRSLGVKVDGSIGPITKGVARQSEPRIVIPDFMSRRAKKYREDPNADHYYRGWMVRLFKVDAEVWRL